MLNNAGVVSQSHWTEALKVVACTRCKASLSLIKTSVGKHLYCDNCGIYYPIQNGIIRMLKEDDRYLQVGKDWDEAAKFDHIRAAAAISKESVESPFVKMPPLLPEKLLCNKVYLDLGCGYGRTLIPHAKQGTKISLGIDISSVMLDKAMELCRQYEANCILVHGDILDMPFQDNSFDTVYSTAVMLHLDNDSARKVMSEIKRLLKPGGKVFLIDSFPNKWHLWRLLSLPEKLVSLIMRHLQYCHRGIFGRFYTYSQVMHSFDGFSRVNIFPTNYQLLPKNVGRFGVPFRDKVKSINEKFSRTIKLRQGKKKYRLLNCLVVHFDVEATL